jgi:hypothetical protein
MVSLPSIVSANCSNGIGSTSICALNHYEILEHMMTSLLFCLVFVVVVVVDDDDGSSGGGGGSP